MSEALPRHWCWKGRSLFAWSGLVYLLLIGLFGLPVLIPGSPDGPLFDIEPWVLGGFPMTWLVYLCLPLGLRDWFVFRKQRTASTAEFRRWCWLTAGASLLAYPFLFHWF